MKFPDRPADADDSKLAMRALELLSGPLRIRRRQRRDRVEARAMSAHDLRQLIVERAIQRTQLLDTQARIESERDRVCEQLLLNAMFVEVREPRRDVRAREVARLTRGCGDGRDVLQTRCSIRGSQESRRLRAPRQELQFGVRDVVTVPIDERTRGGGRSGQHTRRLQRTRHGGGDREAAAYELTSIQHVDQNEYVRLPWMKRPDAPFGAMNEYGLMPLARLPSTYLSG